MKKSIQISVIVEIIIFIIFTNPVNCQTWNNCADSAVYYYYDKHDYQKAMDFTDRGLRIAEKEVGKKHYRYVFSLYQALFFCSLENDKNEFKKHEDLFEDAITNSPIGNLSEQKNYFDYLYKNYELIGRINIDENQWIKASNILFEAKNLMEKLKSENELKYNLEYVKILMDLGRVLYYRQYYYDALKYFDEAMLLSEQLKGIFKLQDNIDYLQCKSLYSLLLLEMNDFEKAYPYAIEMNNYAKNVISHYNKMYGSSNLPMELQFLEVFWNQTIYTLLINMNRLEELEDFFNKQLDYEKKIYGIVSHEYSATIENSARFMVKAQKFEKADSMINENISILNKLYTKERDSVIYVTSFGILADIYQQTGRYRIAEEYLKKNLGIYYKSYWNNKTQKEFFLNWFIKFIDDIAKDSLHSSWDEIKKVIVKEHPVYQYDDEFKKVNSIDEFKGFLKNQVTKRIQESKAFAKTAIDGLIEFYTETGKTQKAWVLSREFLNFFDTTNNVNPFDEQVDEINYLKQGTTTEDNIKGIKGPLDENHPLYCRNLNEVSQLYFSRENYEQAIKYAEMAVRHAEKYLGKKSLLYTSALSNLGMYYLRKDDNKKALEIVSESFEIVCSLYPKNSIYISRACEHLILVYMIAEKYDSAKKYLYLKKEISKKNNYEIYQNLGLIYSFTDSLLKSKECFEIALDYAKKKMGPTNPDFNECRFNLALINFQLGYIDSAESQMKNVLDFYINYMNENFTFQSESEKFSYLDNIRWKFNLYPNIVIKKEHPKELLTAMYDFQLSTKGIILNNSKNIAMDIHQSNDTTILKLYNYWQDIKEYLIKLYSLDKETREKYGANIDTLEYRAKVIEKQLSYMSKEFNENQRIKTTCKDIQRKLSKTEAAIEILRFNNFSWNRTDTAYYAALILTKDCKYPKLVLLQNGNEIDSLVNNKYISSIYRAKSNGSIELQDFVLTHKRLTNFYNLLWKPIRDSLPANITTVYVSPDGVYNKINFNILINPESNKYLLEELDIRIVGSTRDIVDMAEQKKSASITKTAALFGDPLYYFDSEQEINLANADNSSGSENNSKGLLSEKDFRCSSDMVLPFLPATREEVQTCANILEQNNYVSRVFLGDSASEYELKNLNSPSLLFLSTHGYFCDDIKRKEDSFMGIDAKKVVDNPLLRAGLMLAGAGNTLNNKGRLGTNVNEQTEDGILTAYEAMNLNLNNTDLVVLSACETGLGDIKNGEGVYGLQRSFIVAGAKSLLMSYWSVPETATKELMIQFFQNWLSKGFNKREAFKQAQISIKAEKQHPYFWGGFVLIGE